jgi:alkylation response protein AidB-like acyl-CoA dehydrogenase
MAIVDPGDLCVHGVEPLARPEEATMELLEDPGLRDFRDEARTWLQEHVPADRRPEDDFEAAEFDKAWQRVQYEGGWAGVAWPAAAGGRGLEPVQQLIWYEELVRSGAPRPGSFLVAIGHAGPTIITNGTEEQQRSYLPPILDGTAPWCQGFSEPGSGSDLASLRTRGEIDGDDLVINGSKIWTSFAHVALFQEMLVRTDPDAPKHKGISWIVVPMDTPGLEVRRIRTIDGHAHFCECFYTDVRVPLANIVGPMNSGWQVAMSTLSFERGMGYLAMRLALRDEVDAVIALARSLGRDREERFRDELAWVSAQVTAVHALGYDGANPVGPRELVGAVNQVFYGELSKRVKRLAMDIRGDAALERDHWSTSYLGSFPETIAGGSKDIQKNILGERVLGLPR